MFVSFKGNDCHNGEDNINCTFSVKSFQIHFVGWGGNLIWSKYLWKLKAPSRALSANLCKTDESIKIFTIDNLRKNIRCY